MSEQPHVTAVLSLFRPPADLPARVADLLEQVDAVVTVDDGPDADASAEVHAALAAAGAEVIVVGANRGIAHALNLGIERARTTRSDTWVLTLDQDSTVPPGYVAAALATFGAAQGAGVRVGAVCPWFLGDAPTPEEGAEHGFSLAFDPITSALLIAPEVVAACGPFRDDYFIDAVDSEYTLRMRRHGWVVVRVPDTRLEHAMGTPRPMRLLGRQLTRGGRPAHVPYQRPFRIFYITRNMIAMSRQYGAQFPGWLARRWRAEILHGGVRLLWGPHRSRIARALLAGAWAGVRGRSGPIPPRLARALAV